MKKSRRMLFFALAALGGAMLLQALLHVGAAAVSGVSADSGGARYSVGLDRPTKFPADI